MRHIPNTEDTAANIPQVTAEHHMCLLEWDECSSACSAQLCNPSAYSDVVSTCTGESSRGMHRPKCCTSR